jgi:5-methylthioadenosine/S-adenosylhomocysteine deaminase
MRSRLLFALCFALSPLACGDDGTAQQAAGGSYGTGAGGVGAKGGSSGAAQGGSGGAQAGAAGVAGASGAGPAGAGGAGGSGGKGGAGGAGGAGGTAGAGAKGGAGGASGSAGQAGGSAGSGAGVPEDNDAACSDGIDNDGDSYIDCKDFDCSKNPNVTVCGAAGQGGAAGAGTAGAAGDAGSAGTGGAAGAGTGGAAGASGEAEDTDAACSDGVDNDGDSYIDCIDFDCSQNPNVTVCGSAGQGGAGGSAGQGGAGGAAGAPTTCTDYAGFGGIGGSISTGSGGGTIGPNDATLTLKATNHIMLLGTVIAPDTTFQGQVLVVDDKIACVAPGTGCASDPSAADATVIDTKGVISPGLIDTHNHILYDIFDNDDWVPSQLYQDHTQWTAEVRYQAMVDVKQCLNDESQGKPKWCPCKWDGTANNMKCEMNKWGELKGLIAGTTSIVGLPGATSACFASLSRSIDTPQSDLGADTIQASALFPPGNMAAVCDNFNKGKTTAYVIHVGEGLNAKALKEWSTIAAAGASNTYSPPTVAGCLLAPQTAITHGTALTQAEFDIMGQKGMSLVWSPQSNVSLYGKTTDIPAALKANVNIALAPDWSMGGSTNMLDELRFADSWDNQNFGDLLKAKDLVAMGTINAAKALHVDDRLGALKAGYLADILVVGGNVATPYDAVVAATPRTVRLVMVGGKVLYGDAQLEDIGANKPACESVDICGASKFACVAETPTTSKLNQSMQSIKATLEAALAEIDSLDRGTDSVYKFAPLSPITKCP